MNNLQKYRIWKGLKQNEVALIAAISNGTYQKAENNKGMLKPEAIKKLCSYYKISLSQLYDRELIQKKINEAKMLKIKKEREQQALIDNFDVKKFVMKIKNIQGKGNNNDI